MADSATTFSNSRRALRACKPLAPLRNLASLSRMKSRFCIRSWWSFLKARNAPCESELFTPSARLLISCSSSLLAVALSMTSSRTVGPLVVIDVPGRGSSVFASLAFVCCRIETLVFSGIPGMSFSAMARRRAIHHWSVSVILRQCWSRTHSTFLIRFVR